MAATSFREWARGLRWMGTGEEGGMTAGRGGGFVRTRAALGARGERCRAAVCAHESELDARGEKCRWYRSLSHAQDVPGTRVRAAASGAAVVDLRLGFGGRARRAGCQNPERRRASPSRAGVHDPCSMGWSMPRTVHARRSTRWKCGPRLASHVTTSTHVTAAGFTIVCCVRTPSPPTYCTY